MEMTQELISSMHRRDLQQQAERERLGKQLRRQRNQLIEIDANELIKLLNRR